MELHNKLEKSYEQLKEKAINESRKEEQSSKMCILKHCFETDINSPRSFSQVESVATLIEVLEKRGVLNEKCIEPLLKIYSVLHLPNNDLMSHLCLIRRKSKHTGSKSTRKKPSSTANGFSHSFRNPNVNITSFEGKLPEEVVHIVATQTGSSWKRLARHLGVKDFEIDLINENQSVTSHEERTILILAKFVEEETSSEKLQERLLKALKVSDKKTVLDQVKEKFINNRL